MAVPSNNERLSVSERVASFKRALKVKELSNILAISHKTIYKQAQRGEIPSIRVGGAVRFDPKAVADWLDKMA